MKKELDERLCKKYPEIFRDRHGSMMETCMCWGLDVGNGWYHLIDTLCHAIQFRFTNSQRDHKWATDYNNMVLKAQGGDWNLFDKKYAKLDQAAQLKMKNEILINTATGVNVLREVPQELDQIVAVQVKEKYGGLRMYVNGSDDYVYGAISMAELISESICDVCGSYGTLNDNGWISTRCNEHKDWNWRDENDKDAELKILQKLNLDDESLAILDECIAKRKAEQESDDE